MSAFEMSPALRERLKRVRLFFTDVDGTMTDGAMYYTENGDEMKRFHVRDGMGLVMLREAGVQVGMLTSEDRELNRRRAAKLQLDYDFHGVKDKVGLVSELIAEAGMTWEAVGFIGDDRNDTPMLRHAGAAFAPADAIPANLEAAHVVTRLAGGQGCVREAAEMILDAQGLLEES